MGKERDRATTALMDLLEPLYLAELPGKPPTLLLRRWQLEEALDDFVKAHIEDALADHQRYYRHESAGSDD